MVDRDGCIPTSGSAGKRVLEIGCGMGTMAENWARHGACVCAMDLNPNAVATTARRARLFDLPVGVAESNANVLPFADATFDYVFSWGARCITRRIWRGRSASCSAC